MVSRWAPWGSAHINVDLVATFYVSLRSFGSTTAHWYVIARLITGAEEYMMCSSEEEAREWVKTVTTVGNHGPS